MIIQCPSCLAKFKIDDSKIKDEGTKVRCAKCKEVFLVTKEEAPVAPTPPPELPSEKQEFDFSFAPSAEEEKMETPLGFGGGFDEEPKREEETKEEKGAGIDFGGLAYGEVSFSEPEEASPKTEETPSGPDFKAEGLPYGEFEFKEEGPHFEPPQEEAFGDIAITPPPPQPVQEEPAFKEELPAPALFEEEQPSTGFEEEGFPEEFPTEFKKEKRRSFLKIVLSFVIICAVAAVPLWYLWKGYKTAETGEITLADLNGYYTQNAEAGNIFVITGRAVNNTNKARSFFQVKGILFNKKGEKIAQKEVFCGNIFATKEITTLPRAKIESDLKNKVGPSLSNINIAPGKSVQFTVVFFDLPADMSEFSAEVTGSQVASE